MNKLLRRQKQSTERVKHKRGKNRTSLLIISIIIKPPNTIQTIQTNKQQTRPASSTKEPKVGREEEEKKIPSLMHLKI